MLCRHLRDHARTIPGKAQQFMIAFAKALEVIPRQLCDNSGFDATDVLNKLRQKHALKDGSGKNFGVDVNTGRRSGFTGVRQLSPVSHSPSCCAPSLKIILKGVAVLQGDILVLHC